MNMFYNEIHALTRQWPTACIHAAIRSTRDTRRAHAIIHAVTWSRVRTMYRRVNTLQHAPTSTTSKSIVFTATLRNLQPSDYMVIHACHFMISGQAYLLSH